MSCSMSRIVTSNLSRTSLMVSMSSCVSLGFMPAAGSSSNSKEGDVANARAISSFLCFP